jgi:hypothetical protein
VGCAWIFSEANVTLVESKSRYSPLTRVFRVLVGLPIGVGPRGVSRRAEALVRQAISCSFCVAYIQPYVLNTPESAAFGPTARETINIVGHTYYIHMVAGHAPNLLPGDPFILAESNNSIPYIPTTHPITRDCTDKNATSDFRSAQWHTASRWCISSNMVSIVHLDMPTTDLCN